MSVGREIKQDVLVSVVVPIYNVEKYLNRCVESIVNQTYKNLEIILVDDGSPDACPQMCDEWAAKDNRIRVIHKQNEGQGIARNVGIEHASGKYICFFDSDDCVQLDCIEKVLASALKNNVDIVIFGMKSVDQYGSVVRADIPRTKKEYYDGHGARAELLADLVDCNHKEAENKGLCLSVCSCLFSMELIDEVGWRLVSEREFISEDCVSLLHLFRHVKSVSVLPEAPYFYCYNEASFSRAYREDRFEKIIDFYLKTLKLVKSLGYSNEVEKSVSGLYLSFMIAAMKQLMLTNHTVQRKFKILSDIIRKVETQSAICSVNERKYGVARKIFFWAIRNRLVFVVYLLLNGQVKLKR